MKGGVEMKKILGTMVMTAVVSMLGAAVCIQAGVKYAVSQAIARPDVFEAIEKGHTNYQKIVKETK